MLAHTTVLLRALQQVVAVYTCVAFLSFDNQSLLFLHACVAAPVDKDELLELQKQFQKLSKKDHKNDTTITRKQFHEALKLVKVEATDTEILDRLFTLFDSTKTVPIHHHTSCALSHSLSRVCVQTLGMDK